MMPSANDATQLAFCPRLERLNICSLHFESCSCGVTKKPPELLDERRARALSGSHLLRGLSPGSMTARPGCRFLAGVSTVMRTVPSEPCTGAADSSKRSILRLR